jgi:hypothetical protein
MIPVKSMMYQLYRQGKVRINYYLERIIDLCNMFLMDAYRFPWRMVQRTAQCIARYIGDISWLLRDFPRLSAYKLMGADWTVIFVGGDVGLREICHLFFEEEVDQQELGRIALWKLSAQAKQWLAEGADLVVCELSRIHPRPPKAVFTFTVPTQIQQILTLPESLESLISGRKRNRLRYRINRAQKAGFTYRFSQSRADFDHFYYHMYSPFVKSRHGDLALVAPYQDQWQRWFIRGGLILVTQDDEPVAGSLCYIANDTCFSTGAGILKADPYLFQQGINIFRIWCIISWGHDHGAKIFDMGGSHAWRSNGPFAFKRGWGARAIRRKRIYGVWTFLAQNLSPSLQDYLNRVGFISEIDGKFYGILLSADASPISEVKFNEELSTIKKLGLDGLAVVSANSKPIIYNSAPQSPD